MQKKYGICPLPNGVRMARELMINSYLYNQKQGFTGEHKNVPSYFLGSFWRENDKTLHSAKKIILHFFPFCWVPYRLLSVWKINGGIVSTSLH